MQLLHVSFLYIEPSRKHVLDPLFYAGILVQSLVEEQRARPSSGSTASVVYTHHTHVHARTRAPTLSHWCSAAAAEGDDEADETGEKEAEEFPLISRCH